MDNILILLGWIPEPFKSIIIGLFCYFFIMGVVKVVKLIWDIIPFV